MKAVFDAKARRRARTCCKKQHDADVGLVPDRLASDSAAATPIIISAMTMPSEV